MKKRKIFSMLLIAALLVSLAAMPGAAAESEELSAPTYEELYALAAACTNGHNQGGSWNSTSNNHWKTCIYCDTQILLGSHNWSYSSTSTTTHMKTCTVCKTTVASLQHGGTWKYQSATKHSKVCPDCNAYQEASHSYGANGFCSGCGHNSSIVINSIEVEEIAEVEYAVDKSGNVWLWGDNHEHDADEENAAPELEHCILHDDCDVWFDEAAPYVWSPFDYSDEAQASDDESFETYAVCTGAHNENGSWSNSGDNHWKICANCGLQVKLGCHKWAYHSASTGKHLKRCSECELQTSEYSQGIPNG